MSVREPAELLAVKKRRQAGVPKTQEKPTNPNAKHVKDHKSRLT